MKLPLSARLQACCSLVAPGDRVADIGCDHGYLGIFLLTAGIAKAVIAADINRQPLDNALHNAEKFGVRDRMQFYLSDGVKNIPRDFDCMVCAGMGADTIISILSAAPWLKSENYRLILQCQSKTPALRQYLSRQGYCIHRETVLKDGRFLYTVMEVIYRPGEELTPGQCHFPPALLKDPGDQVPAYYRQVVSRLERQVLGQGPQAAPEAVAALQELRKLADYPMLQFLKEVAQ